MRVTSATSIVLESSLSLPLRRTIATSGEPEIASVFFTPADSISTEERTNTTSATPNAVANVVVLRTASDRML